jgi:hypothetical protein
MNELLFGITFVVSLVIYVPMQQFDVASTKAFAPYVDMQKHEVNPFLTFLLRKGWPLGRSFSVLLLLVGIPIALGDALLNTYILLGIPAIAFFLGCAHVVAAISNYSQLHHLQQMTREELAEQEEDFQLFSKSVMTGSIESRIRALLRREGFAVGMSLLALFAIGLLYFAVIKAGLLKLLTLVYSAGFPVISSFSIAWLLALALLMYYPMRVGSTLVMARRYANFPDKDGNPKRVPKEGDGGRWVEVTAKQLEDALKLAQDNNSDRVRIWVGPAD